MHISLACETASLALCAAATQAARDLGMERVYMRHPAPAMLTKVIEFNDHSQRRYSEGTLLLDDELHEKNCDWLNRVRRVGEGPDLLGAT